MAARQLPARRYFAVLALIIVGMYSLIFFTGDSHTPAARPGPAGWDDGDPHRPHPRRQGP